MTAATADHHRIRGKLCLNFVRPLTQTGANAVCQAFEKAVVRVLSTTMSGGDVPLEEWTILERATLQLPGKLTANTKARLVSLHIVGGSSSTFRAPTLPKGIHAVGAALRPHSDRGSPNTRAVESAVAPAPASHSGVSSSPAPPMESGINVRNTGRRVEHTSVVSLLRHPLRNAIAELTWTLLGAADTTDVDRLALLVGQTSGTEHSDIVAESTAAVAYLLFDALTARAMPPAHAAELLSKVFALVSGSGQLDAARLSRHLAHRAPADQIASALAPGLRRDGASAPLSDAIDELISNIQRELAGVVAVIVQLG